MIAEGAPSLVHAALMQAVVTHCAYDAPHKTSAEAVLRVGRHLLQQAGVGTAGERSTWGSAWRLLADGLPAYSRKPWELVALQKSLTTLGVTSVGAVWLPEKTIVLGKEAGRRAKLLLATTRRHEALSWRCTATTSPLLEIVLWLLHKGQVRDPSDDLQAAASDMQQALRTARAGRAKDSLAGLANSLLF